MKQDAINQKNYLLASLEEETKALSMATERNDSFMVACYTKHICELKKMLSNYT